MTVFLCVAVAAMVQAAPQQSPSADPPQAIDQKAPAEADPADLPVSLPRIQRQLAQKPLLRPASEKPVFRMEIFGRKPTIEDILGPDYLKGPVSRGAMTHQEFLAMVTPRDVQGYAAFSNGEAFTVAATSFGFQLAMQGLQKAIRKFEEAREDRARESARREVLDALSALQEARRKAGLAPK
jgi:hypothetical protein